MTDGLLMKLKYIRKWSIPPSRGKGKEESLFSVWLISPRLCIRVYSFPSPRLFVVLKINFYIKLKRNYFTYWLLHHPRQDKWKWQISFSKSLNIACRRRWNKSTDIHHSRSESHRFGGGDKSWSGIFSYWTNLVDSRSPKELIKSISA